jgi:chromosome partitioning protein
LTALSKHAATEAAALPKLKTCLSDLVAYGEMGFSGLMPAGKAGNEVAALMAELRSLGWLPNRRRKTSSVKTQDGNTKYDNTKEAVR